MYRGGGTRGLLPRPILPILPRLYSVCMKPRWLPVRIVARSHRTYGKNRGTVNSLGVRCKTQCTVVAYSSGFDTLEWWYSYTFQTHSLAELHKIGISYERWCPDSSTLVVGYLYVPVYTLNATNHCTGWNLNCMNFVTKRF